MNQNSHLLVIVDIVGISVTVAIVVQHNTAEVVEYRKKPQLSVFTAFLRLPNGQRIITTHFRQYNTDVAGEVSVFPMRSTRDDILARNLLI